MYDNEYWFYRPNVFEDILLINEETFRERLAPYTDSEINLAVWYIVTDGSGVNTSRVDELIRRHNDTEKIADQYLPGTYIQASPVEELRPYQRIVTVLTLTLTIFSIPIVILLIIFLVMLVGLVVDGQRNETAVLRSRGASPFQVVGLTTVEGVIMGIVALIIGGALAHRLHPVDWHHPQLHGLPLGASFYRIGAADHRLDHCPGDRLHHPHPRRADHRRRPPHDHQLQDGPIAPAAAPLVAAARR